MWARIYAALKGLAAVGGVMAFIGFGYTYWKDVKVRANDLALREAAVNRGWLEAELYRVLSEGGVTGLSFEEIVDKVQSAYFVGNTPSVVDAGTAREDAVRRGLLGLAEKNSLVVDTGGRYIVPTVAKNYLTQDLLFSRMEGFREYCFTLVQDNPGRYNNPELAQKLVDKGATAREAWQVVAGSLFMQPPAFVPVDGNPYTKDSKLKVLE